jgi:hypothetical protein
MTMTVKTACEPSTRVNTLFDLLTPVLACPGQAGTILEGPDQKPAALAGVPSSVVDGPDFGPPDPAGSYWLAFTRDHNEDDAAATFRRRYGQLPRYIFDGLGGLLLVGPVPGREGGA